MAGIRAAVHRDFEAAFVPLRVCVSLFVRHGDFGHHEPLACLYVSAHKGNVNDALFRLHYTGLVVDQHEAVRGDDAVEFMVYDGIDFLDKGSDAAADFRSLILTVASAQLPCKRRTVTGDNVVELFVHNVIVFRRRHCQRHQPEFPFVSDGPVAAVASTNPAQHLLHGVSLRIRNHVVHAAVDSGARVNRNTDSVCDFLHDNGHGFRPIALAIAVAHHRLRGFEHGIIAGQCIEVFDVCAGIDPELAKRKNFRSASDVQIRELRDDTHRRSLRDFLAVLQQHIQLQRCCIAVADTERLRCKAVTDLWSRNAVVFFAPNDSAGVHVEASASCKFSPVVRSVPRGSSPPYCSVMLNAMPT